MEVSVSISPPTVRLGTPVTVSFTSSGCENVSLVLDNFPNPIFLGKGELDGSIKVLPLTDGTFNVEITGSGRLGSSSSYVPEVTKSATCSVT